MLPSNSPLARELFQQWQRARGGTLGENARPFSRNWERLLDDAGIVSAAERAEAEADARSLKTEGWLELRTVRYKPHLIARIVIPLAAEARWAEAFGFTPPSDEDAKRIAGHPWVPELDFLRETRVNIPFADLQQLDHFLRNRGSEPAMVPIKERSLEIFGDEKRLDLLAASALFRDGRLNLANLRCEIVGEPLAWKRGPADAAQQPVIVLENAATWHSYGRWNDLTRQFSAVIYGGGNRFADGVLFLPEIFRELGGPRPVFYFGDLDPAGLAIPQRASRRSEASGLPPIQPHLWSYEKLLAFQNKATPADAPDSGAEALCQWLGPLADNAWLLFSQSKRLPQEHLGRDFLQTKNALFNLSKFEK